MRRLDQIKILPRLKTRLDDWSRDKTIVPRISESKETARAFNDKQKLQAQERLIDNINRRIDIAFELRNKSKLQALEQYIRGLRPSFASLRKYYIQKGDSAEIAYKLVTKDNYEHLPQVHLTKEQQQLLLNKLIQNRISNVR